MTQIKDNQKDYQDLKKAVDILQSPTITAKISDLIGSPIEKLVNSLPTSISKKIGGAVEAALHKSANAALWSLENKKQDASPILHKIYAASSGAIGGAFGFTALFIELPIATTIMMRSVADIARSEGFDLTDFSTKQLCIEVFAMGGNTKSDDATETGYYVTRSFTTGAMQQLSKELAEIAAKQGSQASAFTTSPAAKWMAELIEKVAARFGVVITEKFAAQAVPVIGAVTGAGINTMFIDFYQDMALGHFTIKRLEQKYGFDHIKKEYNNIVNNRN